ncbi:hypothetical protein O7621_06790 [Solwaraspora sp. WMMD937]|uniref:hypothetical protein n=1 Tax=Solwaraspora sp. WMMD937 TaxID=3016090 RepID=UPI00249B5697|nr:hypothetical protein [Solwaraspora sp. WMMD937]WFE23024.1 hypothetical protein O7621_06790 [Solwaraspora sp. WMMD937]
MNTVQTGAVHLIAGFGRPAGGDTQTDTQRDGLLPAGEAGRPLDAGAGLPFSTGGNPP